MVKNPIRDLIVGVFVLAGLTAVAYLSLTVGGVSYGGPEGMTLYASFDEIGGLKPRAPVVISGVKVGQVTDIELSEQFRAKATLEVDPDLEIPIDSSVSIVTSGLLGDRYLSLQMGGELDVLVNGDEITFSESAVLLERLIGKFVYNSNRGGDD